jgi:hypothetical protein
MNINEYKKYLQSINNTLDNASQNYQMRERLSESPVCDMKEYKPDGKKDKSSHAPTTAAGDSLRPHSKKSDAPKKLKEDEDIIEIPECVQQYFENYFGDNLNEDTDDEDILTAVEDLVDLCEAVCDAVGLHEGNFKVGKVRTSNKKGNIHHPAQSVVKTSGEPYIARGTDSSPQFSTPIPKKFAGSKRKISTIKIPAGAKIKRPQITPKIDASQLPVVGPGQPDYHQM